MIFEAIKSPYRFSDWQSGQTPPDGWDAADAVRDGWSKSDLDAFMRATVKPWSPTPPTPADKPAPPAGTSVQTSPAQPRDVAKPIEFKRIEQGALPGHSMWSSPHHSRSLMRQPATRYLG